MYVDLPYILLLCSGLKIERRLHVPVTLKYMLVTRCLLQPVARAIYRVALLFTCRLVRVF